MKNLLLISVIMFLMPLACLGQQKCFSDSLNVTEEKGFLGIGKDERYCFRGVELEGWQQCKILSTYGDSIAKQYYSKSRLNSSCGGTIFGIGLISSVVSLIPFSIKFTPGQENNPAYFTQKKVKSIHRVGAAMLTGGVACTITGVFLRNKSHRQYRKAIESYNAHIGRQEKKMSYWELKQEGAGAALVYNF